MNRFLDILPSTATQLRPMTTTKELGEHLAHLVWESFSDFLTDPASDQLLEELEIETEEGIPDERVAGEILIFHLWTHTRAVQLAFYGSEPAERMTKTLDALHRAFFEDMVENGTPEAHLPVFEQRVSARYSEYNAAASRSDTRVGEAVAVHLVSKAGRDLVGTPPEEATRILRDRARELANPLQDFLADVELDGTR